MRRAWVLMEVILALSIFTMAALVVLSAMNQSFADVETARQRTHALDLARSALAQLEAGLKQPDELIGPVPAWSEADTAPDTELAFEDDLPEPTGWELEIDTNASAFPGLTLVTVTALRRNGATGEPILATTLHQLIRLSSPIDDTVGEQDELATEAIRGAGRARPGTGARP
ncbi:MAG: hypothetical protein KDA05_09155 [Phycisphaerales bacterium]|nr:hypothetical protein [Phycisphaerales bacterium]